MFKLICEIVFEIALIVLTYVAQPFVRALGRLRGLHFAYFMTPAQRRKYLDWLIRQASKYPDLNEKTAHLKKLRNEAVRKDIIE